jgi:iron complex outermembrane recepter protein
MMMEYRSPRGCAVLTFACALLLALPAAATDSKSRFDIPAEDLGKALRDFAIQANRNLSYDPASVKHLQAPAIKGDFTVPDALSLILRGTHLRAVNINENTIQVLDAASTTGSNAAGNSGSSPAMLHIAYAAEAQTPSQEQAAAPAPAAGNPSTDDNRTPGLEEIIVTGTHISGVDNKTVPLLVFDRAAIERSGYATTEDFIASLPQNVKSGANSADGILNAGQGFGNVENSTAANLRGLGSSSTLTLLNGHRVAPSSYGTGVDLSMIPLSAVERVEVLTDGSSAVYGSDAVGGVINIILRKDFNGAETTGRFDTLSKGGGEQKQLGQSLGRTWETGGVLGVVQFQDTNAIHADERSFTEKLPEPTDIYPSAKRWSGVFSGHQTLLPSLELFGDALYEHNDGVRDYTSSGFFGQMQRYDSTTNSTSANLGLRWQPFGDWHLEGDTLFSQVDTLTEADFTPATPGYTNGTPDLRNLFTIKEADLKLDGTLWESGGSSVKAAIGGSYRREAFSSLIPYIPTDRAVDRRVSAEFAELYAPLITAANAITAIQKLEFSAAVRNDSYSDFGAKTNPRFGVFWAPMSELGVRAAYSTSFRAPDPSEIITNVTNNNVFILNGYPLPNDPKGAASVIFFGDQPLGPETSKNFSAGLDYEPKVLSATRFSLNYYRIVYSNRITDAPTAANVFTDPQAYGPLVRQFGSDAAVAQFIAGLQPPPMLFDFTPGGTGLAGVRYGFPFGNINATKQITEGFDLGAHSSLALTAVDKLVIDINATYIKELSTAFCTGCATTELTNTIGEPLKFRLRAAAGWSNALFSANAALNFANAYTDTNIVPFGRVSAFTTADLNAAWRIPATGSTIGIYVTNLFNADPPRTAPSISGLTYDPANADPRGRTLSVQIRQKW